MKRRGVIIILICTFIAVFFYGYRYVSSPVKTMNARLTKVEDITSAKAYVIRNEAVYYSQNQGTLYNYVAEGARVGKDSLISTVYNGSVDEKQIKELNNIDNKITKLKHTIEQNSMFTRDKSSIENKLENIRVDIVKSALNNDLSAISEHKSTINYLVGEKNSDSNRELNALIEQKRQMEVQMGGDKSDIYSTISGVFSDSVDGYEGVLTPEWIVKCRVGDFVNIESQDAGVRVSNSVDAGEAVCKVVDNHNWYVMTVVKKEEAEEIRAKKEVLIRFDDLPGEEVVASVEYISTEEDDEDEVVLVLKSDRYLEGVYSIRSGIMDIVVNRYTGYNVPVHSIRVQDGKNGVMKSVGNAEIFCECDIVYKDEEKGTVIVYPASDAKSILEIGDSIVLGEKVTEEENNE